MKLIKVGIIGSGLMCKLHSQSYALMPLMFAPSPYVPVKKVLCDVTKELARTGAENYLWEDYVVGVDALLERDDIDFVDIVAPNRFHREIAIAAARAGKNIYCEKPLGIRTEECLEMCLEAEKAGVKTAVAFNKRRWPAVVYAKQLIDRGEIGDILYFRGTYQQSDSLNPDLPYSWRYDEKRAGYGVVTDIGSHVIDLCRYLVGEFEEVIGMRKIHIPERPMMKNQNAAYQREANIAQRMEEMAKVTTDDTAVFMGKMKGGAMSLFDVSRCASGQGDGTGFEIWGSRGAIRWNMQYQSELQVSKEANPEDQRGFTTIQMGTPHPYGDALWCVPGFGTGLADNKALEIHDVIRSFEEGLEFHSNFRDGLKVCQVVDAVVESQRTNSWVKIQEV